MEQTVVPKKGKRNAAVTFIVLFLIVILISCYLGTCLPGTLRMMERAKNAEVKMVAHAIQLSIEDYKNKHYCERPISVEVIELLLPAYAMKTEYVKMIDNPSEYVKNMKNPFNSKETYTKTGGGLVDGEPVQNGQVGYIAPATSSEPYRIIACGADHGKPVIILELIEELSKAKPDSGVTKGP